MSLNDAANNLKMDVFPLKIIYLTKLLLITLITVFNPHFEFMRSMKIDDLQVYEKN